MIRAAAVLVLALGSCGGLSAPSTGTTRGPMIRVEIDETWWGVTFCEGDQPSAWVRADMMLTDDAIQLVAHELQHKRDLEAFGNCAAFRAWVAADPWGRGALLEASAYCASVRADVHTGRLTEREAYTVYSAKLAYTYPFGLSAQRAEMLIREFCDHAQQVAP